MYTLYAVNRWEDGKGSRINLFDDGAMALAWMQDCISSSQRRGEDAEYTMDPVEVQEYWTCEGDVYDSLEDVLDIYSSEDHPVCHRTSQGLLRSRRKRAQEKKRRDAEEKQALVHLSALDAHTFDELWERWKDLPPEESYSQFIALLRAPKPDARLELRDELVEELVKKNPDIIKIIA